MNGKDGKQKASGKIKPKTRKNLDRSPYEYYNYNEKLGLKIL